MIETTLRLAPDRWATVPAPDLAGLLEQVAPLRRENAALRAENPMRFLAMQVAFTVPLCIPLVLWATRHQAAWFYPGFMIVVGAHYLPFVFLYGMPAFAALGGLLVAGGWLLGFQPQGFTAGGWATGAVLLLFGLLARRLGGSRTA